MYVVIAGGGRTGAQLARFLLRENHDVHIVEDRKETLARIHHELPTEAIHEGNPVDLTVLEEAGIQHAGVLAACTTDDETNLVLCYVARTHYNVHRTIARVNDPRDAWLFNDSFYVDVAINQAEIMARLIEEEMSMGDMMTLLKLRRGDYSLVEEKIPPGARGVGLALKDLGLDGVVIAAIIRHGEMVMPRGVTTFEEGDEVLAVTDPEGARKLAVLFASPTRPIQAR